MQRSEGFVYSGPDMPIGGRPGDVLTKLQGSNYYAAWRDLSYIYEHYDVVLDDGEY